MNSNLYSGIDTRPPSRSRLPQAGVLLLSLILITLYRMWIIPHLGVTLYIDEAQYWTWAQQLDWGYYSKPPVIAWLIAASTALFGDGLLAVKLPALILYPATAWILFSLGTRLFDSQVGIRAGLAFMLMPLVAAFGLLVATDAPLLFFWAAAMLCLLRALEHDRWRDWILLGICVGLGLMSKYTMAAFGLSALLYLLADRSRRPALFHAKLWVAVGVAALIFLPNILWNWAHDFPTLRHTANITHVDGTNNKSGNPGEFLLAQLASLGPGIALAFLGGLWMAFKQWHSPQNQYRMQFLLCFSLPLLMLVFVQAFRSEANGNWAAPALLACCILAVAWLSRFKLRWWLVALGINVLIMLAAYHFNDIYQLTGRPLTAKIDPLKRAKGWDMLAKKISPLFDKYPHAMLLTDNRTLMAHMLYQLRGSIKSYAEWAPNEHPADHYQLVAPLKADDHLGRTALLIIERDDYSNIAEHFNQATLLKHIEVEVEPGLTRQVNVVLLEGFKGYH